MGGSVAMSDPVQQTIRRTFPEADAALVRRIVDQYGTAPSEREHERVQLAVLGLSGGDLAELRTLVAHAKRDYRDVLYWAALAEGYADPVADRLIGALLTPALTPRRLALLHETVPTLSRIAVLWNPAQAAHEAQVAALEVTARERGVGLQPMAVGRPGDFEAAFAAMRREHAEGLVLLTSALHQLQFRPLAALALRSRLATIGELGRFAQVGGLLSYGPRAALMGRRTVAHLRSVLERGQALDSDSAPPTLDLLINLQTARALGLAIPQSVLEQATEVIR